MAFLDHPVQGDDGGAVAIVDRSGKKKTLTDLFATAAGLAWSPDGEIWFTAAPIGNNRALYSVTPSGRARLRARVTGNLTIHDIFADGRLLMTQAIERQGMIALPPGEQKERDLSWLDWSSGTDLSPDGKTVLFTESGSGGGEGYSVYLRKTDGSPAVRLGEGSTFGTVARRQMGAGDPAAHLRPADGALPDRRRRAAAAAEKRPPGPERELGSGRQDESSSRPPSRDTARGSSFWTWRPASPAL